jgi:hypothetical protein
MTPEQIQALTHAHEAMRSAPWRENPRLVRQSTPCVPVAVLTC